MAVSLIAVAPAVNHLAAPTVISRTEHRTVTAAITLVDQVASDGTSTQIGVADSDLYNLGQTQLVQQLSEIKSLGVTDIRIGIPWVAIQPTSTTYDWSTMDNIVKTASSMGLQITGDITENPSWDGTVLAGAPNPTAYANFAAAVAQRYAGTITSYEIWNEPNGLPFFAPVSPAAYTAVLKAAYTAIKAVNPSATVIAGALGAAGNFPGVSMTASSFLAGMYAAGAAGYFDALSYHPYGNGVPLSAGADVNNSALQQVTALYALMTANGDAAKKIWATEFGAATTPGTGASQPEQAQLLEDFVSAWSRLSFAGPAFYYSAQDLATGVLNDEGNYGLFTSAGVPKAAAAMLATLIADIKKGILPNYTAPLLSQAQLAFQQIASMGLFITNAVLLLPNALISGMLNAAPAPIKQVFSVLSNAIVAVTAQAVSAVAPVATAAIGVALAAGPAIQK
ncbi:MAG: cellulase family glycosylhydrolase, partial [Mycobacterium sp.]